MKTRRSARSLFVAGIAIASIASLAACSSGGADAGSNSGSGDSSATTGTDPDKFTVLSANENKTLSSVLDSLAADEEAALGLQH